jgi:hypothetical protein
MTTPPPDAVAAYTALLERAILNLRMRLRYGEEVSPDEVHDYLDALHNVPTMLRDYGGWHVEENIDADLAFYDERWLGRPGSELRTSLVETLRRARAGEFDPPGP